MASERCSEQDATRAEVAEQPKPIRSSQKTIMVAVVVSVITIGTLVMWRGQVDGAAIAKPAVASLDDSATKAMAAETNPQIGDLPETIKRSIEGLSDRIHQWFDTMRAEHSSTNHDLSELTNSMSAIHESIAELRKGNKELKQRIADAQSQLQVISQNVRTLKITTKKKTATQRKQKASRPPFHIDAIDLWDDAVYVAVSNDGRVAFLREGEQQAGWQVAHIDRFNGQVALRGPEGQDYSASIRR